MTRKSLRERFDEKWERDPQTGCWLWTGTRTNPRRGLGYGRIAAGDGTKRLLMAPRVAWELFRGPIPDGMCVLHNCPAGDDPRCVNPEHLWLGTQADNIADMIAKGRFVPPPGVPLSARPRGENNGRAKLNADAVREIRRSSWRRAALARRYGVTPAVIRAVQLNLSWRHVS